MNREKLIKRALDQLKYEPISNSEGESGQVYFKYKKHINNDILRYINNENKVELEEELNKCKTGGYYGFTSYEGYSGLKETSLSEIRAHINDYTSCWENERIYCFN